MSGAAFLAPVAALPSIEPTRLPQPLAEGRASATGFSDQVAQGLQQVNQRLLDSQADLQRLAAGQADNLHRVMLGLEESRLSFQLMLQVRNRLLESYQELMRTPV